MKRIKGLILVVLLMLFVTACGNTVENPENIEDISVNTDQQDTSTKEQLINEGLGWGAVISFGSYEQDNNLDNGKEPIEWIVLDVQEDQMLLLSKKILDAGYFNENEEDDTIYWDECTLRDWLNQNFVNEAFDVEEQNAVILSQVVTSEDSMYDTEALSNTQDKVFLLSIDEVDQYFKIAWGKSGHFYDNDIKAEATEYAISKGLKSEEQRSAWYLRSTGLYGLNSYSCVTAKGGISTLLRSTENMKGIRPAIWVNFDVDFEILQKEAADTRSNNGIEDLFPAAWEGRYVLEEKENSINVYCKKAYDAGEVNKSLLFSIYRITGDLVLPDDTDLGTYDGDPIQAVVPWEIREFSTDEITEEYTDMIYDVGGIIDVLRDRIAELEHYRQVELYGFDLSLYTTPDASSFVTGVYQLDCGSWSEASKNELLGEYNHTSYLSVAPDGTVYLSLGSHDPIKGTLLMVADESILPEDEPECIIWFEDGIIKPAYYLQLCLTIHGMEDVELKQDALKGLKGSVWTYNWVSDEFWTELSLRGDIG